MFLNSGRMRRWMSPKWLTHTLVVSGVDRVSNDIRPTQVLIILRKKTLKNSVSNDSNLRQSKSLRFIHPRRPPFRTELPLPWWCSFVLYHTLNCAESRSEMTVPAFTATGFFVTLIIRTGTSLSRSGMTVFETLTPGMTSRFSVTQFSNSLFFGPERSLYSIKVERSISDSPGITASSCRITRLHQGCRPSAAEFVTISIKNDFTRVEVPDCSSLFQESDSKHHFTDMRRHQVSNRHTMLSGACLNRRSFTPWWLNHSQCRYA